MFWYVSTLGFWMERYSPSFNIDPSTLWWSGADWSAGAPIDYHGQVLTATQVTRHDSYPDFFHVGQQIVASERFRDIVENLEPGIHQFFPTRLLNKSGEPLRPPYFLFNVTQSLDAVIAEESDLYWKEWDGSGLDGARVRRKSLAVRSEDGLVMRKIAGRHLHMFRNQGDPPLRGLLFFSNELMASTTKVRVSGIFAHLTREA